MRQTPQWKHEFRAYRDIALITACVTVFSYDLAVYALGWSITSAGVSAALLGYGSYRLCHALWLGGVRFWPVRGRVLVTAADAERAARRARRKGDPGILWGGVRVPSSEAYVHFAVAGAPGSGKTLTLRLLMQDVLPLIGQGRGHKAVLYDAKRDLCSLLAGMGLHPAAKGYLLNPFDQRGVGWNMAADLTAPHLAEHVAHILIPPEQSSQPYFDNAARELLSGVMISFMLTHPGIWTLRDVLLALRDLQRLQEILGRTPTTSYLIAAHFGNPQTLQDILSTLSTRLQHYATIAAAWSQASTQQLSLSAWLTGQEESILILGTDPTAETPLRAINQVLFKRLVELVLNLPERQQGEERRVWFILDELRQAGRLQGLADLLREGRSKGACVVLGFQDKAGLEDAYNPHVAQEILGQCGHYAILRQQNPETARWAEAYFGQVEGIGQGTSGQSGARGASSHGWSRSSTTKPAVLASEFQSLPPANFDYGLAGYYDGPQTGAYYKHLSPSFLGQHLKDPLAGVVNFDPRPASQLLLQPWNAQDLTRLGLAPTPQPAAAGAPPPVASPQAPPPAANPLQNIRRVP